MAVDRIKFSLHRDEGETMSEGLSLCSSSKMQPIRDLIAKVAGMVAARKVEFYKG